mmetsp:Transcript_3765/g.8402  ORF Transcript_3765/g.8402 Transcript_3765/m.8402 type:complete len:88 (+) Transcript_3765:1003-1266(+)
MLALHFFGGWCCTWDSPLEDEQNNNENEKESDRSANNQVCTVDLQDSELFDSSNIERCVDGSKLEHSRTPEEGATQPKTHTPRKDPC